MAKKGVVPEPTAEAPWVSSVVTTEEPVVVFRFTARRGANAREVEFGVPLESPDSLLTQITEKVGKVTALWADERLQDINAWFNDTFVKAYLAVSTPERLAQLLVAMARAGEVDPGQVIMEVGDKHAGDTVHQIMVDDARYIAEFVASKSDISMKRIAIAAKAYVTLQHDKEKDNEQPAGSS